MRIGVLGCGPIAQVAHFDAVRKAENAELYAICDVAEDLCERMRVVHQPRVSYTSYEEMLDDPNVEGVIIAVADQYHVSLSMQAISAGKHVLVEKPLGVSVEECELLASSVEKTKLILQVGCNRRFDPGVELAKRFMQQEMGQLLAIKAWYCDSTVRYTMTDNLHPIVAQSAAARRPSGNPKSDRQRYFLLTHGSHLVDLAAHLAGKMVSVDARLVRRFDAYCWFVSVDFEAGSIGHLDLTIPIRGDFEEGFRIYGENGSINGRLYLPWYHKAGEVECYSVRDGTYRRRLGEDGHTYKRQIEAFADAVHGQKAQVGATVWDGVDAVRALVAIAESVRVGKRVWLADVSGSV